MEQMAAVTDTYTSENRIQTFNLCFSVIFEVMKMNEVSLYIPNHRTTLYIKPTMGPDLFWVATDFVLGRF